MPTPHADPELAPPSPRRLYPRAHHQDQEYTKHHRIICHLMTRSPNPKQPLRRLYSSSNTSKTAETSDQQEARTTDRHKRCLSTLPPAWNLRRPSTHPQPRHRHPTKRHRTTQHPRRPTLHRRRLPQLNQRPTCLAYTRLRTRDQGRTTTDNCSNQDRQEDLLQSHIRPSHRAPYRNKETMVGYPSGRSASPTSRYAAATPTSPRTPPWMLHRDATPVGGFGFQQATHLSLLSLAYPSNTRVTLSTTGHTHVSGSRKTR